MQKFKWGLKLLQSKFLPTCNTIRDRVIKVLFFWQYHWLMKALILKIIFYTVVSGLIWTFVLLYFQHSTFVLRQRWTGAKQVVTTTKPQISLFAAWFASPVPSKQYHANISRDIVESVFNCFKESTWWCHQVVNLHNTKNVNIIFIYKTRKDIAKKKMSFNSTLKILPNKQQLNFLSYKL